MSKEVDALIVEVTDIRTVSGGIVAVVRGIVKLTEKVDLRKRNSGDLFTELDDRAPEIASAVIANTPPA